MKRVFLFLATNIAVLVARNRNTRFMWFVSFVGP